jgi:hypothetical protein
VLCPSLKRSTQESTITFRSIWVGKSGIKKELAELIFFCSKKGIGPSRLSIGSTDKIQYMLLRIESPLVTHSHDELKELQEHLSWIPKYTSDEICGIVPSVNSLVDFYCKITQARCPENDSQMIRKYQSSSIFSIDALHKVPKWMVSWMEQKMYDALITSKNEYFESLMSFFALSDNHKELKTGLVWLRDLGFQPQFGFLDVPKHDKSLLEEVFVTLRKGLTSIEDDTIEEGIPTLSLCEESLYSHRPEDALGALAIFIEAVGQSKNKAVSFDFEYSVYDDDRESGDPVG